MPEKIVPGPVCEDRSFREAVCIHTKKIFDSCRDKDCIEDLRVYPTRTAQEVIDRAIAVKAKAAQLLCAHIDVQSVGFNRGFFSVDVRFFYRIIADAFVGSARPTEVCGLAVFDKRVILFGGESGAKVFSSRGSGFDCQSGDSLPIAEVEAVDPIVLNIKLVGNHDCRPPCPCDCAIAEIPGCISDAFGDDLMQGGDVHRLYVTLGQFSIIRLERDTHLLMPVYDYCMPDKECNCGGDCPAEDPCEIFRQVKFPVNDFFPACSGGHHEPHDPCCSCQR